MTNFDVMFTDKGDLSYRVYNHYGTAKFERNYIFPDILEYTGYFASTSGNSHIKLKSLNSGRNYHMFMADFYELIQSRRFLNNQIVGLFTFCKKGVTQGIRLILEP